MFIKTLSRCQLDSVDDVLQSLRFMDNAVRMDEDENFALDQDVFENPLVMRLMHLCRSAVAIADMGQRLNLAQYGGIFNEIHQTAF